MTFWDHLDELRGTLIRIAICLAVVTIAVFACKNIIFSAVLAPASGDFYNRQNHLSTISKLSVKVGNIIAPKPTEIFLPRSL